MLGYNMDKLEQKRLLSVIRLMAEDIIRCRHPHAGCPVHGQSLMRRIDNGLRYCGAAGCHYESAPGNDITVSTVVNQYLEKADAH